MCQRKLLGIKLLQIPILLKLGLARIQTFTDWYEFSRGTSSRNDNVKLDLVYKQIGNAVPVKLTLAVAEPIAGFVKVQLKKRKRCMLLFVMWKRRNG